MSTFLGSLSSASTSTLLSSSSGASLLTSKGRSKRTSLTILVLGDDGVGKSSLIWSFVSRSNVLVDDSSVNIPDVMPKTRLPIDRETGVVTTIVDSKQGDVALMNTVAEATTTGGSLQQEQEEQDANNNIASSTSSTIHHHHVYNNNVDSIVLVFDLSRYETFIRLENHWLPLIERCYHNVPVIVVGNKADLLNTTNTTNTMSRQDMISLMQRYRFVRQYIKNNYFTSSSVVQQVFSKARSLVLYPVSPLYDLTLGQLTSSCRKAFTRIFRICDDDMDGLIHCKTFSDEQHDKEYYTCSEFLTLWENMITRNRFELPWRVLRKFGYHQNNNNDELILLENNNMVAKTLSSSSLFDHRDLLRDIFGLYERDGILSCDKIREIFSVLSISLPPWHSRRRADVYAKCYSLPKNNNKTSLPQEHAESRLLLDTSEENSQDVVSLSASGITIVSADTLPTVHSKHDGILQPMTMLEWLDHWHVSWAISPAQTRMELIRLGFAFRDNNIKKTTKNKQQTTTMPHREARILVLGSQGCGKTTLLEALCSGGGLRDDHNVVAASQVRAAAAGSTLMSEESPATTTSEAAITSEKAAAGGTMSSSAMASSEITIDSIMMEAAPEPTTYPETSGTHIEIMRKVPISLSKLENDITKEDDEEDEMMVHLIFTEVPAADVMKASGSDTGQTSSASSMSLLRIMDNYDSVLLVFDSTDPESLEFAIKTEQTLLHENKPRMYIGTKMDNEITRKDATEHCKKSDLDPPLFWNHNNRKFVLQRVAKCALHDEPGVERCKSKPHEEQRRREWTRRRKICWWAGLVGMGFVVVASVSYFFGGSGAANGGGAAKQSTGEASKVTAASIGWFQRFFS